MRGRIWLLSAAGAAATALVAVYAHWPERQPARRDTSGLRYDTEYPFVDYSNSRPGGRLGRFLERLDRGAMELEADSRNGYLSALLRELDIDASSQLLVFSKTSVQTGMISPETPRAIYFNDDTYVAFIPGAGSMEVAAMDPGLGPTFFALDQATPDVSIERRTSRCLRCHDSTSLTGGGVPRFLLGSGYIDATGELVSHEGWFLTDRSTSLSNRWGGWYVSGYHGDAVHLGNLVVRDPTALQDLESLRVGNLGDLEQLLDTSAYLSPYSDIVALLVIEHQIDVQNALTRASYDVQSLLQARGHDPIDAEAERRVAALVEPLVKALFSVAAAELPAEIRGTSGFAEHFQSIGRRDSRGRSLRDLALSGRLFRYPLSYLIHSEAFDALPEVARRAVGNRVRQILNGADAAGIFLSADDRTAIMEILSETKPALLGADNR